MLKACPSFFFSQRKNSDSSGSDAIGSDEHDSDTDLQKELKPLSAYLRDRAALLDQMLHSVRGPSLNRALPDVLKVKDVITC